MTRPHVTIAHLMGIVLIVGFGFAALRNTNEFWASATFTVAVSTSLTALVGACAHKGKARATWGGYAAFGLAGFFLWYATSEPPRSTPLGGSMGAGFIRQSTPLSSLLTEWGLRRLQPYIQHPVAQSPFDIFANAQIINSLNLILFSLLGAVLCRLIAPKDERPSA
jgi:hypothetical protein